MAVVIAHMLLPGLYQRVYNSRCSYYARRTYIAWRISRASQEWQRILNPSIVASAANSNANHIFIKRLVSYVVAHAALQERVAAPCGFFKRFSQLQALQG